MHTDRTYHFATEAQAQEFYDWEKPTRPNADKYVSGPTKITGKTLFPNNPDLAEQVEPYWVVRVERFT